LRSLVHDKRDLPAALRETADTIAATGGVRVSLSVEGVPRRSVPATEKHLLRIGQEAISNAVRHADATDVRVRLCYEPASVVLRVSDDGVGFDAEGAAHMDGAHWGLRSMRERAEQAGGRLRVRSSPGRGTDIEASVP
jgi:signal transduction histidine kinase